MAQTASSMLKLASKAKKFCLTNGITTKLYEIEEDLSIKGTLIIFICNHCPYVIHVIKKISQIGNMYQEKGIQIFAINSNDVIKYPDDSPEKMITFSEKYQLTFPYLFDESQEIAKAYTATCTPDFFLFDHKLELIYRGQLDSSRPENNLPVTGKDLRDAMDNLLNGNRVNPKQRASIGCNIKWK